MTSTFRTEFTQMWWFSTLKGLNCLFTCLRSSKSLLLHPDPLWALQHRGYPTGHSCWCSEWRHHLLPYFCHSVSCTSLSVLGYFVWQVLCSASSTHLLHLHVSFFVYLIWHWCFFNLHMKSPNKKNITTYTMTKTLTPGRYNAICITAFRKVAYIF